MTFLNTLVKFSGNFMDIQIWWNSNFDEILRNSEWTLVQFSQDSKAHIFFVTLFVQICCWIFEIWAAQTYANIVDLERMMLKNVTWLAVVAVQPAREWASQSLGDEFSSSAYTLQKAWVLRRLAERPDEREHLLAHAAVPVRVAHLRVERFGWRATESFES